MLFVKNKYYLEKFNIELEDKYFFLFIVICFLGGIEKDFMYKKSFYDVI